MVTSIITPGLSAAALDSADDMMRAAQSSLSTARQVVRGTVGRDLGEEAPSIAGQVTDTALSLGGTANEVLFTPIMAVDAGLGVGVLGAAAAGGARNISTRLLSDVSQRRLIRVASGEYTKAWNGVHQLGEELMSHGIAGDTLKHVRDMRYALGGGVNNMNHEAFETARKAFEESMTALGSKAPKAATDALKDVVTSVERSVKYTDRITPAKGLSGALRWTGNTMENAASWVRIPKYAMDQRTVGDVAGYTGIKAPKFVTSMIEGTGSILESIGKSIGLSGWRAGAHEAKATKFLTKAEEAMAELTAHLPQGVSVSAGAAGAVDRAAYTVTVDEVKNLIRSKTFSIDRANLLRGHIGTIESSLQGAASHSAQAASWKNIKGAVANVSTRIGNASLSTAALNSSFLLVPALATAGIARTASQQIASGRQMLADMTGRNVKDVSTYEFMTASVPPIVAEARSHVVKENTFKGLIQAGGFALAAYGLMKKGHIGLTAMLAPQGASMAADFMMGESVLAVYAPISKAYRSGQPLAVQDYAAFIAAASKELANHRNGPAFAHAVAEQYVAMQPPPSPAQILQEMQNGKFHARLEGIAAAHDHPAAQAQQQVQHQPIRPVVGHHTAQLKAKETRAAGQNAAPTLTS